MAIDKITPLTLNKSSDERLVKRTEMTDAKNVTVSTDSSGNGFVLKTSKGNQALNLSEGGADMAMSNRTRTVIGSVTDLDSDYIYFFVHVQSNTINGEIWRCSFNEDVPVAERIIESSYFDFDASSYVDADVLRVDTNQEGSVETIVYFTDGINEPRKINVDRALEAGFGTGYSETDLREFLSVCKTAPRAAIKTYCDTDVLEPNNSVYGKSFCFAYQYVYKDGEESALSNYSDVVIPSYVLRTGFDDSQLTSSENVINVEVDLGSKEVSHINMIYRDNSTGVFYKIGKFSVSSNDEVNGKTIWDFDGGEGNKGRLRFYNNLTYSPISELDALKLFDNVPQKANAQTISNSRLFYGGYSEGYPESAEAKGTSMSVDYSGFAGTSYKIKVEDNSSGADIKFDFSEVPEVLYYGNTLALDFTINTNGDWEVYRNTSSLEYLLTVNLDGNQQVFAANASTNALRFESKVFRIRASYRVNTTSKTREEAVGLLLSQLKFNSDFGSGVFGPAFEINSSNPRVSGSTTPALLLSFKIKKATMNIGFSVTSAYNAVTGITYLKPFVSEIQIGGALGDIEVWDGTSYIPKTASTTVYDLTLDDVLPSASADYVDTIIGSNNYLIQSVRSFSTNSPDSNKTWKSGVNHDFGIVYFDKHGRSGPVNEIGSVYVKHLSEREKKAKATIDLTLDGGPDWATDFSIVYGGNQDVETFKQYSVADGFYSFYHDTAYDDSVVHAEEPDDRIYVSLKSWQGSKVSYVGDKGVDYDYKYKEGDMLRVIRYSEFDSNGDESFIYPDNLEFKIADKVVLRQDISDSSIDTLRLELEEEKGKSTLPFKVLESLKAIGEGDYFSVLAGDKDPGGREKQMAKITEDLNNAFEDSRKNIPYSARNPIYPGNYAPTKGHFLVLEDPGYNQWGAGTYNGSAEIHQGVNGEYETNAHVHNAAHFHQIQKWGQNVIVEIYTPKVNKRANKVYKEINATYPVPTIGTTYSIPGGDVWWKNTPVVFCPTDATAVISASSGTATIAAPYQSTLLSDYSYSNVYLESESASHYFYSRANDFGRPLMVNKNAATNQRRHSITYSDSFNSDSPVLRLSDFNLGLANYSDLSFKYGLIDKLIDGGDFVFCIQDSKVSRIPVGKNVVNYSDGSSNMTVSKNVMGAPSYYQGDYGSSNQKGSIVAHGGKIYFMDINSNKVFRLSSDGLTDISSDTMDAFFNDKLSSVHFTFSGGTNSNQPRISSGFDPDTNEYLLTVSDHIYYSPKAGQTTSVPGFTLAFNEDLKSWTSEYSFKPDCYGAVGDKMVTGHFDFATNSLFWLHADKINTVSGSNVVSSSIPRAKYYGESISGSVVEVVSNNNPSMTKAFESLGLETTSSAWSAVFSTSDQATASVAVSSEKERGKYAAIPRDTGSSHSNELILGEVLSDSTGSVITFSSPINFRPIPVGSLVYKEGSATNLTVTGVSAKNKLTISGNLSVSAGDVIKVVLDAGANGEQLRDYFCKVRLTNSNANPWELYGINVNFDRSNLGQEVIDREKISKQ